MVKKCYPYISTALFLVIALCAIGMYQPGHQVIWVKLGTPKYFLDRTVRTALIAEMGPPCSTPYTEPDNWELLGEFECTAYADGDGYTPAKWDGVVAHGDGPYRVNGGVNCDGWSTRVGWVAVDPDVIPLHTTLYVDGYGRCEARDTGSAIKGRRIDLFYPSVEECDAYGRRMQRVWTWRGEEGAGPQR